MLDMAIVGNQVAETVGRDGYHTRVEKGKFMPSKYGEDEYNYLHDLMNSSYDGSGPMLVTVDDKKIAREIAAMYRADIEETGLGTYRIVQRRGAAQQVRSPELSTVTEEQNPRIDLTPNYPNYETLIGEFVGAKNNKLLFKIVAAELKPAVSATEKITKAVSTGKLISIELSRVKNRKVIPETDDQYRPPGISASQARSLMTQLRGQQPFVWKRPNQISGSHAESELLALGFKKSKYNTWGGTQAMWDRLAGIPESADYIEEKISR